MSACSGSVELAVPDTPTPSAPSVTEQPVPTATPEDPTPTPDPGADVRPSPTPFAPNDAEPLPLDQGVLVGTLDNGLTYYIRNNTAPGGRAELRLAVKAGSALEDDDQSAVAHFLEHMLFNGTAKYPSNELIALLESFGSQFGPDVNAYTSFDETVYELSIPTDDAALFEEAFDVLFEWATNAAIDSAEVEAERGVVLEEWRLRDQGVGGRINNVYVDLLTPGTDYEGRLPIGEPVAIEAMTSDVLQRFYDDWYRPDLMAIVAVGDFNVEAVERLIRDRFEGLENPQDARQTDSRDIAEAESFTYVRHPDPEFPTAFIEVIYPGPANSPQTIGDYRRVLAYDLAATVIETRFADDISLGLVPYLDAYTSTTPLARGFDTPGLLAEAPAHNLEESFELLLIELERVRRDGFTTPEINRARSSAIALVDQAFAGRDTTQDAGYASEYVEHFLGATPALSWADFLEIETQLLQEMTPDYVAGVYLDTLAGRAPQVVVIGPEADVADLPSEDTVRRLLADVPASAFAPRVDDSRDIESLMTAPDPAPVVTRTTINELDATQLTFANGVTVVLKPTQIAENSFNITGLNPGGLSVLDEADLAAAFLLSDVVFASGVGNLNQVELDRLLADQVVFMSVGLSETEEFINAGGATEDAEVVLQLLNQYLASPRVEQSALDAAVTELLPFATDPSQIPFLASTEEYLDARFSSDERYRLLPSVEALSNLTPADMERVYNEAFGDAAGSVFAIAGDFELAAMEALVSAYLGTLPSDGEPDVFRDVQPLPPPGVVQRDVQSGPDPQGSTTIVVTVELATSLVTDIELQILENVLSIRLRDRLREALGATYSPVTSIGSIELPDQLIETRVEVSGDPDRLDEIVAETIAVLADLADGGLVQAEAATAREQIRRDFELVSNNFWIGQMLYAFEHPDAPALTVPERLQTAAAVTVDDLSALAAQVFTTDHYIVVNLVPVDS